MTGGKEQSASYWFVVDDDCWQCCRILSDKSYEFIQICNLGTEHGVAKGIVELDNYTDDNLKWHLECYGYNVQDFNEWKQINGNKLILAEMVFETEWMEYLLDNRFPDSKDAKKFIAGIVDCSVDDGNSERNSCDPTL